MHLSYTIIDDFFPDPDRVREAALALDYPVPEKMEFYPGRNSTEALKFDGLDERISQIVGRRVIKHPETTSGATRIALEGDTSEVNVHVDRSDWSAIIYLSLDEHARGGTDFFRHKRTGMDRAPVFPEDLQQLGYTSPMQMWDDVFWPDTNRPEAWEKTFTIPMRFNRMALFRSYLWHNATPGFGTDLNNGRLILTYFFKDAG